MDNLSRKKWIAPLKDKGCARRKEYVITDLGKQMAANGWRLVKTSTLFYENQHV